MPEDRSRYLNDEEAVALHTTLHYAKRLLHGKLLKIAKRQLGGIYEIEQLQNKIRYWIDDTAERLVLNRDSSKEAELTDNLICYLLVHRIYMGHYKPDMWGEQFENQ